MTHSISEPVNGNRLKPEKAYLRFAAVCAFITVLTTIVLHRITTPSGSFEENVNLYKNTNYLFLNWLIIFHCLMVLFSMLGAAFVIEKYHRPLAILGFLFFMLFVFSEWQRTLNSLWHINGLRKRYVTTVDETTLQALRFEIQYRLYQSGTYFLLFTLGFTLGNTCYGLAVIKSNGLDKALGAGLLLWAACTSLAFISDFYPAKWMEAIVDACNKYYQPLIRLLIGWWLFKKVSGRQSASV